MNFSNDLDLNLNPLLAPQYISNLPENIITLKPSSIQEEIKSRHQQKVTEQNKEEEARLQQRRKQIELNKNEFKRIAERQSSKNDIDCEQSQKQLQQLIAQELKRTQKNKFIQKDDNEMERVAQLFASKSLELITMLIKKQNKIYHIQEKYFDKNVSIKVINETIYEIIKGRMALVQHGLRGKEWTNISEQEINEHIKQY